MWLIACAFGVMLVACGCVGVMGAVLARHARKGRVAWLLGSVGTVLFVSASLVGMTVALYGLGIVVAPPLNDWRLRGFSEQLFEAPLPEGTVEVGRESSVGVMGNGNHCDYVASRILRTRLDEAAVREHFVRLPMKPAMIGGVDGDGPELHVDRTGDSVRVMIIDGPYEGSLDMRCH